MSEGTGLLPVIDVPGFKEEASVQDRKYKKSVKWDLEKGDFIRDQANRLVTCDGIEAYKIWCFKVVQTERFEYLAYPAEIGVEMEEAMKEPDNKAVESAVERTIQEAIEVNPRTEYVRGFSFRWEGDEIHGSFLVKGVDWNEELKVNF